MNRLKKQVNDFERQLIIEVLNQNNVKVEAAAMVLEMPSSIPIPKDEEDGNQN